MMHWYRRLIDNHPLANITFVLVLVGGIATYLTMPRAQDPEINFNWVNIITTLPGASAEDIERELTGPLEDAIKQVKDIKFVSSSSREAVSSILVRFEELSEREFDKRANDLRREIQNKAEAELPPDATDPQIIEITTSNGFPTAILVLYGAGGGESLRGAAFGIKKDLERLAGVDQVVAAGFDEPQLHVDFDPERVAAAGLSPTQVSDAVSAWFRNTLGGRVRVEDREWLVRLEGKTPEPEVLAQAAVITPEGRVALGEIAAVARGHERATQRVSYAGRPSVMLSITKQGGSNTLELVDRLNAFVAERNPLLRSQGVQLALIDDQTHMTRNAIGIMESNALIGLLAVLGMCWLFLGTRLALLVGVGVPFALAGTFLVVNGIGSTLNLTVLLGVVIALGMLVDDAVVVVEAIYYRVERGAQVFEAAVEGVAEVFKPVLSSVATTLAAFLPLMLLPGIVGKFMFVIPFVVTLALLISLAEAFWMLPTHVTAIRLRLDRRSRAQHWRNEFNRRIRLWYGKTLAIVLRQARASLAVSVALVAGAAALFASGLVQVQFFAFDPMRIYYVNIDMPAQSTLEQTLAETQAVERAVRRHLKEAEVRSVVSLAGLKFTETEPVYGDPYGQVTVSLNARGRGGREVTDIVEAMRADIESLPGPGRKTFTLLSGGPPKAKPINIKVRGDDYVDLRRATDVVKRLVADVPGTKDVTDDDVPGRPKLVLNFDHNAVRAAGLDGAQLARLVRILVDGEVVAFTREEGDKIEVRVRAPDRVRDDPAALLAEPLTLPNGQVTRLGALMQAHVEDGKGFIRHYNLRRSIAVEANLDEPKDNPDAVNTQQANRLVQEGWARIAQQHPGIDLEFSGELEDIQESLDAMGVLFALGVGLIFLILATQFVSYWQPLMILVTVPLAFTGVTFGLALTRNPLSLFTMYGVIALTGIAVNSAIVLIDAANDRHRRGMSTLHSVMWAARRRVVPILITSMTTIGGLFALATGLGGKSLLWGPVAASIVWGLAFSTVLTLYVVPLLYLLSMRERPKLRHRLAGWFARRRRAAA
jgi:multidrug efflux pump subunit AcrB